MTRVLIVDDHPVVRAGVRALLEQHGCYQIVGEAADGKEAIATAIETKPDVVVLDYSLPVVNGIEVARQVREHLPKTAVLFLTFHDSDVLVEEALRVGVAGYLLKSDATRDLLTAIATIAVRKPFFTGKVTRALLDRFVDGPSEPSEALTNQERKVMMLMAEGHKSKQIAEILGISSKTVDTHRTAIIRKLKVSSTVDVIRYAVRNQLVEA